MRIRHILPAALLVLLIACAPGVHAVAPTPTASEDRTAPEEATLDSLARDAHWLKLLHYEAALHPFSAPSSAIHDASFFLAPTGGQDPVAELRASLHALDAPVAGPDSHFRCRYPARAAWLDTQRRHASSFDTAAHCPALLRWTRNGTIHSLSVVFATGYLGNPASYYGHTLLKFNSAPTASSPASVSGEPVATARQTTALLDTSVNYGAILAEQDNPLTFIVKSLIGGYDAGFSHIDFYYHDHQYGENELRDLWEYELAMSRAEVDQIVAHAWEVLGKRYTYFFFRENCAYRMAEVLNIVGDLGIIPPNRPWTIPQALVQRLDQARWKGRPLVRTRVYHPSRQARFYARYRELEASEAQGFKQLASEKLHFASADYQVLPIPSRQKVVDTLLDYRRFADGRLDTAQSSPQRPPDRLYRAALAERYALPPAAATEATSPPAPHRGRPPGWLQTGVLRHAGESALSLRIRPAYYDALDADASHAANTALSMGDMQLLARRGSLRLHRLDLIAVESVKAALTGLPADRALAWKLRAGAEPANVDCQPCTLARVQGDVGLSRVFSPRLFGAAYLGGAAQDKRHGQGAGFARASADLTLTLTSGLALKAGIEHRLPFEGSLGAQTYGRAELRWAIHPLMDMRLLYEQGKTHSVGLGIGSYW